MNKRGVRDVEIGEAGAFDQTRWTLVSAARNADSSRAAAALNDLCQIYWYPLYCYIRRRGYSPEDAQDLVQGFFERILQKEFFSEADQARGRLRGFLLSNLQYYLLDERKRAFAAKRGGNTSFVPIDATDAELRYEGEGDNADSPDRLFERRWAATVMQRALQVLADAWRREGKSEVFDALSPYLLSPMDAVAARGIGAQFQMTENHVKVSLYRLRMTCGIVVRKEIADTVNSEAELESELAVLRAAVGWWLLYDEACG